MIIRRARPADLENLVGLMERYLAFYKRRSSRARIRGFMARQLQGVPITIWVATRQVGRRRQMHGFVQVYPTQSTLRLGRAWILNDLFVAEEARRTGAARALMLRVIREAARERVACIELATAKSNVRARRLYESLGFNSDRAFLAYAFPLT
jgi:ribosomal protein S18 acetylase RimI-like enzyme